MSAKLPLTIDNPTSTGVVRYELHGDRVKAKLHLHEARKVLGALKQIHGVNSNPAQDGGGFFSRTVDLEDGTRIVATTNHGQDVVSIKSPAEEIPEEEEEKEPVPVPEDTVSFIPFLWVGVRYMSGGVVAFPETSDYSGRITDPHLCVWEPKDPEGTDGADSGDKYNIVSNRYTFMQNSLEYSYGTDQGGGAYKPFDASVKSIVYPLGPSISENLEVWENPEWSNPGEYDVIIRSKRTEADILLTDISGNGSVIARSGRYQVKCVMALLEFLLDKLNATPVTLEITCVVGRAGSFGRIVKKVTVELDKYSSYHCDLLPKGWHARLAPWKIDGTGGPREEIHVDDFGPVVHDPWWQSGFDIHMPNRQDNVLMSAFDGPKLTMPAVFVPSESFNSNAWVPSQYKIQIDWPEDLFTIAVPLDIAQPRTWLPRMYRAPAVGVGSEVYVQRIILGMNIVTGALVFTGADIKRVSPSCSPETPVPSTLNVYVSDSIKGYATSEYAGDYEAMDTSSINRIITLYEDVTPGGGVQIWNKGECFGAKGPSISLSDGSGGSPPGGLVRYYAKYSVIVTDNHVVNGDDYGWGQAVTDWTSAWGADSATPSSKAEFLALGGLDGYTSTKVSVSQESERDMDVY